MIGGGELKIDPMKIEAISKWLNLTSITKVRSFMGAAQYLQIFFFPYFSIIVALLHAVTAKGTSFHGGKQQGLLMI